MKKYIITLLVISLMIINVGCKPASPKEIEETPQNTVNSTYEPEAEINNINIEDKNADIILQSTVDKFKVISLDKDNPSVYDYQVQGDTLTVVKTQAITTNEKSQKLIIQMPKKKYGEIKAQTDNGDMVVGDVEMKHLEINLQNGDAKLKNVKVENLGIECSNGDITIEDSPSSSYNLETSNGNIKANIIGTADEFQIESKADFGENSLKDITGNSEATKNILAITKNGDIDITFSK